MATLAGTKGGAGVWQRIVSELPEHDVFIEPFWGRGTISRKIKPAEITVGVDLDPAAISDGAAFGALMFQACGLAWLREYFRPGDDGEPRGTLGGFPWQRHCVYIDPPYLGCSGYYSHELTEDQHVELMRLFLALPCPAALSGYITATHRRELQDCRRISYVTVTRGGKRVREYLWLNFEPPAKLHDTRHIGRERRERERIRRRRRFWAAGLARLPQGERQAVFDAIQEVMRRDE